MLPNPGVLRSWILATEKVCEFAANRKPKPRATIFAAGAGIGLLEGFKDNLLFFRGDTDARIGHLESDHLREL